MNDLMSPAAAVDSYVPLLHTLTVSELPVSSNFLLFPLLTDLMIGSNYRHHTSLTLDSLQHCTQLQRLTIGITCQLLSSSSSSSSSLSPLSPLARVCPQLQELNLRFYDGSLACLASCSRLLRLKLGRRFRLPIAVVLPSVTELDFTESEFWNSSVAVIRQWPLLSTLKLGYEFNHPSMSEIQEGDSSSTHNSTQTTAAAAATTLPLSWPSLTSLHLDHRCQQPLLSPLLMPKLQRLTVVANGHYEYRSQQLLSERLTRVLGNSYT